MPNDSTPLDWNPTTHKEAYSVCQELYDALNDAYWYANSIRDKDRIKGVTDLVFNLLTQLNRQAIAARSAEYDTLRVSLEKNMPRFDALKDEIDDIVHSVAVAARVATALDRGIRLAGRLAA